VIGYRERVDDASSVNDGEPARTDAPIVARSQIYDHRFPIVIRIVRSSSYSNSVIQRSLRQPRRCFLASRAFADLEIGARWPSTSRSRSGMSGNRQPRRPDSGLD
jgi:hypothetical protein